MQRTLPKDLLHRVRLAGQEHLRSMPQPMQQTLLRLQSPPAKVRVHLPLQPPLHSAYPIRCRLPSAPPRLRLHPGRAEGQAQAEAGVQVSEGAQLIVFHWEIQRDGFFYLRRVLITEAVPIHL
jgi:hypothetical protein